MAEVIRAILSNFPFSCLILGLVVAGVAIARDPRPRTAALVVDKLLAWHIIFVIGVGYAINFVMHAFFGRVAAASIGWADSPFQFEVGTASLGFAAVGFYAAFRNSSTRVAAILGPALFMLGAAVGHVRQMIVAHNFAPGNAGLFFWMDIIIPLFGFALLVAQSRLGEPTSSGNDGSAR